MGLDWKKVLPIVSSVGVTATCGLSFWGGKKYEVNKEAKGKKALFYLLPGIASAVGTIISIAVNGRITGKEFAALTGSCAFLVAEKDKFKDVLKERMVHDGYTPEEAKETIQTVTEEAHARTVAEIAHKGEKFIIPVVEETGHGNLLCIDTWSGRAFRASKEWVDDAIRSLNVMYKTPIILNEGTINEQAIAASVGMCDLFKLLNIYVTTMSGEYGWPGDQEILDEYGPMEIPDLGISTVLIQNQKGYNEPVLFIEYTYGNYPMDSYYEY